jgi:hypothetical protein
LLKNNVLLTKDNMVKRKWTGNPICMFCNQTETANHLFFQCCVARYVWGQLVLVLVQTLYQPIHTGTDSGYKTWSQMERQFITLVLLLSAGHCGNAETKLCLKRN